MLCAISRLAWLCREVITCLYPRAIAFRHGSVIFYLCCRCKTISLSHRHLSRRIFPVGNRNRPYSVGSVLYPPHHESAGLFWSSVHIVGGRSVGQTVYWLSTYTRLHTIFNFFLKEISRINHIYFFLSFICATLG